MLIFLILFILTVIFIAAGLIIRHFDEDGDILAFVAGLGTFSILVLLIIGCTGGYAVKDLTVKQYLMKYAFLQEQLTNEFYKTEYLDQRQKLMEDILEYNSDVINGRFQRRNPWLNWFYPEDWDSIPLIEFESEKGD